MKSPLFRVKRGDGKYFWAGKDVSGADGIGWFYDPNLAIIFDPSKTAKEQIIESFAWVLAVDVTAEDVSGNTG